jgi:hypothetical protein
VFTAATNRTTNSSRCDALTRFGRRGTGVSLSLRIRYPCPDSTATHYTPAAIAQPGDGAAGARTWQWLGVAAAATGPGGSR